jgi:hypothetical protein
VSFDWILSCMTKFYVAWPIFVSYGWNLVSYAQILCHTTKCRVPRQKKSRFV